MKDNDLGLALERLVAERKRVGPSTTLEQAVWAIPATTPPQRRWIPRIDTRRSTVFSAVKLVAASLVVALFGGFLLAGVLTAPSEDESLPAAATESHAPTMTKELPASIVTEEVEPGVLRVVRDGQLDLTQAMEPGWDIARTVIAPDGSAWMFGPEYFFRLGSEGDIHDWPVRRPNDTGFASNGDVWASYPQKIRVFDGRDWTTRSVDVTALSLEFAPDGEVWALGWDPERDSDVIGWFEPVGSAFTLAREDWGLAWDVDEESDRSALSRSSVAVVGPDAGLDSGGSWIVRGDGTLELYRWATGEWEEMPSPPAPGYGVLGIGPEGTVWMASCPSPGCWGPWADRETATLARLEGEKWMESAPSDHGLTVWGLERVAPDGSIWGVAAPRRDDVCSGIVRFDGAGSKRWLDGHCIEAIELDHDGSVWVQAFERSTLQASTETDDGPVETYVITPAATKE